MKNTLKCNFRRNLAAQPLEELTHLRCSAVTFPDLVLDELY